MNYYTFSDNLGYGTFEEEVGEARRKLGLNCTISKIPIIEINEIIEHNFKSHPNIIDIDIEGMDYDIIKNIDTNQFPVEIFMCETLFDEGKYITMMKEKGYLKYASVGENTIFYKKELNVSGLIK